jgi:hypothetical protein
MPSLNKNHPIMAKVMIPTAKPMMRLGYISPLNAMIKF